MCFKQMYTMLSESAPTGIQKLCKQIIKLVKGMFAMLSDSVSDGFL